MRRVLLLSYYFPPSGGPGVQRVLKFTKYLPGHGWQPTVLTVSPDRAAYPSLDPSLLGELSSETRVVRTGAWDPYALYARLQGKEKGEAVGVGFMGEGEGTATRLQRLARWIRANVFLPDARVGWVPYALRRGAALLRDEPFDAVLSSGPPHSAHLAARRLARRAGLPWVADLRDPWTGIDYYAMLPMSAVARRSDAALERSVLSAADAVTAISPAMARHLAGRVPRAYTVLPNGFDPDDFAGDPVPRSRRFAITYVGDLSAPRDPVVLWQALAQLGDAPIDVRLVGRVDPAVLASARRHGVAARVHTEGYVAHAEAVRRMRASALLLLVINRVAGAEGIMTGKLYEYVGSGRPVLGVGPPAGDAAAVLAETGAGRLFDYDDVAGVAAFVRRHYEAWTQDRPLEGSTPERAAPYSRRAQAAALARLLDTLTL